MNEIIKTGISLMIIAMVAGILLAFAYQSTKTKIEEQKSLALKNSLKIVFADADDFKEQDGVYKAYKGKNLVGEVRHVTVRGYSSGIELLYGVDLNNTITGVQVLNQQETPGLGGNIAKEKFLKQFVGKSKSGIRLKKDKGDIDAVTGATISSRAVTNTLREK